MVKLENVNKYFNKNKKNEIHIIDNTSLEFEKTGLVAILRGVWKWENYYIKYNRWTR